MATLGLGVVVPVATAPSADAATGTVSGTVFNDYDNDGVLDAGEPGVAGAVIYGYDSVGTQYGPATTNASGVYSLSVTSSATNALRIELQGMPSGYQTSRVGTNSATTIRFENLTGATLTNIHFAIQKPGDYCEANPDIATTLFCVGNGTHPSASPSIFHSDYDSNPRTGAATFAATGSVLGVAWNPVANRIYTAAYVKRHAGLNDTWGADAIYTTNPTTNTTAHWFDLADVGITVGTVPTNADRGITGTNMLSNDPVFDEVGKIGIGDIDTNGVDTLYVTNLLNRTVHAIPIPADGSVPTTSTSLGIPTDGSGITCTNGTARPFGLAFKDGYIYAGIVCDAGGAGGTRGNLDAYVTRTTGNGTWTQVGPRIDLDYNKGLVWEGTAAAANNYWQVWDDTFDQAWDVGNGAWTSSQDNANTLADWISRPTPMFSDIAFDDDGSLILGFRDRTGDMIGADNRRPLAADTTGTYTGTDPNLLVYAMAGGDILRVCNVAGTLTLQGGTGCANVFAAGNAEGPGNGEYYDDRAGGHREVSIGHVAVAPRSGQLLLSAMNADPDAAYNSAGIRGLSNTTGATLTAISESYYVNGRPGLGDPVFAKANGMGDVEALCDAAPLEIGNRVWRDNDADGIQDAGEPGIDNVTVQLYDAAGTTLLGTAVTSGGGQYYFRTGLSEVAGGNGDNTGGGLAYRTAYQIRIGTAANYTSGGPLVGLSLTTPNLSPATTYAGNQDTIDSDPAAGAPLSGLGSSWFPTIAVTAGSTLPGYNNHTYDAGFVPPSPYDLALRKTYVSMAGTPASGTITFRLEVFNQTANAVNDVTVTDYIDTASFQALASAPASGTTGGSAALPYSWSISGGGASGTTPKLFIDGVIPGNSSVTVDVTLAIANPARMAGLRNWAEISVFDNDGNPANGDSTNGAVYDVDSIPDASNTDTLSDDVINLARWTNTGTTQTENTGVADEDDHDIAVVPVYDLALIKTRSAGQPSTVTTPATTASFDITVKNQGQTPVFNVTVLDSPTAPLTRSNSTPASQTVTTTLGASVTVTYNSGTGTFTIPTLAVGDTVRFQMITTLSLVNTVQVNTAEITGFDNDADGSNAKPTYVQDVDSTPDTNPANDVLQANGSVFAIDSHNTIDNPPVNATNALDEDDHDSEGVQLGLLRIGSTLYKDSLTGPNANNVGDAGEEVQGVLVQLFKFNGSTWDLAGETVTNANGDYSFDRLYPGTYQVGIPTTQSHGSLTGIIATALSEWEPVAGSVAGPETSNFDNDGDAEAGFISRSDTITLTYDGEPTNDDADDADADALTSPRTYTDINSNLNIDFVFDQVLYQLGNLVWSDGGAGANYNNGVANSDETGLSGVTVELYRDNGAGAGDPNDGVLHLDERIATTTTTAGGFYTFGGLTAASDYYVAIVKSTLPLGYAPGGTPVAAASSVDNDNNAFVNLGTRWASGAIALGPVSSPEPTGETDGTTGADASPTETVADNRADQTVDFGFVPSVRIGNQVWRDESDTDPRTEVATDNDGVFNSTERGLAGVTVQLWRDVNTNGTFERAGADAAGLVATTATNAEGNYWFENVRPGVSYFVVIPTIGTVGFDRPASSTGQSASSTAGDNVDDGAPVGSDISVSRAFTPTLGGASLAEADAIEPGDGVSTADATAEAEANAAGSSIGYDDNDSELRIDFGFVTVPVYRVGNLVWLDNGGTPRVGADERDGAADATEVGIAGVTVSLYTDNGNNAYGAGDTLVGTAVTDANGKYAFENLVANNYFVVINTADGSNATVLAGLTSTTDGATANTDADNDDNGVVATGGWASSIVTLGALNNWMGGEPTTETLRSGVATDDDNGASWTAITTDPALYADSRSNFSVDFGFAPVYRLGNLVWLDTDNDGVADAGESGISNVQVELVNPTTGAVISTTTTDGSGRYVFTGLNAGSYAVRVVPSSLPAYVVPGGATVANADNDVDNDNNAASPGSPLSPYAATVTLGGAEPTNEVLRSGSATDDDNDSFSDAASNVSVDFGFWPQLRLGNVVWMDQSDTNPATYVATDNNGVVDAGETLLAGVTVSVWRDGGNGIFDAGTGGGDDVLAGSDVTDAEGNWLVTPLAPGVYFASILSLPAPYASYVSSLGQSAGGTDNDDNGAPAASGAGVSFRSVSTAITLAAGTAPTGEVDTLPAADGSAETEANVDAGHSVRDNDSNLTVDFGFVSPPLPYDLALRKTFVSMTGTPASGTVTFRIEIFNQTADSVNDVTVTDYIDTDSFDALTVAPSSGTTAGAAALPYSWSISGGGASGTSPKLFIDGVIPGNSSVSVDVTLTIADPVRMDGLVNHAEISVFDNDGTPANGDSSTGAVYDIDSIPDSSNTDALVDDDIDDARWTNTASTQTENTGVADEDDHDVATVPVYDLALIKTRSSGQDSTITSPATTASFDITVKNQGETDVFNVTVLDSPTAPLARDASTPASQSVTTTLGASVTVTYDSGTGVFTIPALAAGDSVRFQLIATLALVNTVQINTAEITGFDNDANGANVKPTFVQDVDSTPDTNPANDVLQANGTVFPIDSHNTIDNPPVNAFNPLDEDDHDSEAVQVALLRIGSTVYKDANGNDVGDTGEEVAGVLVQLFEFNGSTWDLVDETVTDANGDYSFDQLYPGTYQVGIPETQSHGSLTGIVPTALSEWEPVAGSVASPETDNFDNDGDAEASFISRSDDIVLTYNAEPTNDDADDADADALTSPRTYTDANSNLNIDFVFEQITYEIGNLVWSDGGAGANYNNSIADSDEDGIPNVEVELFKDDGAGAGTAGDGILHPDERIATDTTDANGFYSFTGLVAGDDYYVVVVKSSVPAGYGVASGATQANLEVDNDNNAFADTGAGWSSGAIFLGPVASPEPTGEVDGTTGLDASPTETVADNRADQTVDFGFIPTVRIGNQVWRDESDTNPATEVATDNNGQFDTGELGLAGVTVELWQDKDTDGVFEPTGDDGPIRDAVTVTDAEGNYWFEGVRPGVDYFVAIASIGSLGDLEAASSTGQSASATGADNDDDGAPFAGYLSVSTSFTASLGGATENEEDAVEPGDGASTADATAEIEANLAGTTYADDDSELAVDFGFVNVPVYRVGNLVWFDNGGAPHVGSDEADGMADATEPGIAGVTVALYADNGSTAGSLDATDTLVATAVTDADGTYAFENLVAGNYLVFISDGSLGVPALDGTNASLLAGLVSTLDGASANADIDNDDNGVAASGGWASSVVTLGALNNWMGAEPTNETLRSGVATADDDGSSWTASGTDPAVYANSRSNFTVDFGFASVYRLGNLVWLDANNDGTADAGEAGIPNVDVELLNATTGAVIDTTTTDADGHYLFTNLPAGTYAVHVVPASLPAGVVPGGTANVDANNDVDNDNNAASPASPLSAFAATVTLGGAEPTDEVLRAGSVTDDDNDSFADSSSNVSVDFGFWPQLRIGNVVWIDESDANPATYAATDNNGIVNAGETLLAGVTVTVWLDGGDGFFDAGSGTGDDTFAGSDVTDSEGNWLVTQLAEGTYFAAVQTLPAPYAAYGSSLGQSLTDVDNDDNGAAASAGDGTPYVGVSGAIELTSGGEATAEVDALPAADGSAESEANTASGVTLRDVDSNLTVDLGFVAPPTYRIGNLVWRDTDRDGSADAGEPGISGVLVQLLNSVGTVINETVTDANGAYAFTTTSGGAALVAGDYRVRIPASQTQTLGLGLTVSIGALSNLSATGFAGDPDSVLADNDSNGDTVAGGWQSPFVTLGGSAVTFETEPTNEVLRSGGDDDLGWASGTDARSEFTVDFGFFPGLRLGDTVWFDDGRTGPGTSNPLLEDDGIYQTTELPAADVTVLLFEDDGDGVFEPGADDGAAVQTTLTDAAGEYFFLGLDESVDYWVAIPAAEQGSGAELEGFRASTPVFADGAGTNDRNHGTAATGYAAVSPLVDLTRGGMAYGDAADEANANTKTGATVGDADSNLVIDFGFSPEPLYRIANLVWLDSNDNGSVNSGETGIANVTVQLFADDGDGVFEPGVGAGLDGAPVATDTTGSAGNDRGRYGFDGLSAGSYWVYVPSQSALSGMDSSVVRNATANDDIDNDNNAIPDAANGGWGAGLVELGAIGAAGENDEPLAEEDDNTAASAEDGLYLDGRSNQTVDFGFAYRVRVGNQVWRDESDSNPATQVATDNNGIFNAGEVGIAGVPVELWFDVNGDGFQGPLSDDTLVETTTTNAEGNYWFVGLVGGPDFYVAIPVVGFPLSDVRSSAGQAANPLAADNDDDGAATGDYLAVSNALALTVGAASTGEADAVEPGNGVGTTDATAEAEANALTDTYRDIDSYLRVDFGFINVPLYRIGNLVWLDTDNDGRAEAGENPLAGVLVQLVNAGGSTVIAETVTDVNGKYAFANLAAGDYRVRVPYSQVETLGGGLVINAAALSNLASSTTDTANANGNVDNDDNGVAVASGWQSGQVTLGAGDDSPTETEPVNEVLRQGSATDDDTGWAQGTDARSNFSVDFGFYQLLRLGDIVWLDNGGSGAGYVPANEDNGVYDTGEVVIDGVTVRLYRDNGNNTFGAGDTLVGAQVTTAGHYYFTGLTEGTYFAAIADTEHNSGQELEGLRSSTGQAADFATNDRDQGAPAAGYAALTRPIVLDAGTMNNGDSAFEALANASTGVTVADASSNLAVDFGFSPEPTYALGNLVWEDVNNDGTVDAGEPGIAGLTVQLYLDVNDDGLLDAGDTLVDTDVTGNTGADLGRYLFEDLPAGSYLVHIPATVALSGWYVGGTPVAVADSGNSLAADNDNNAVPDVTFGGWTSGPVELGGAAGPADNDEPVGETDANTSADAETPVATRDDRSNQTVDFGFWRGLRLGNQVWRDESDGSATTTAVTDNNGDFDASSGEVGIAGVDVELWRDTDGDGFEGPASDDVLLGTDVTDGEGNYLFEHLAAGSDYFVAIPSIGAPLTTARSSAGQSGTALGTDNDDDGAPLSGYLSVSTEITLAVGSAITGESDAVEPGDGSAGPGDANAEVEADVLSGHYDDASSFLDVDFGFIEVPLYRLGNLVWLDADNDGVADAGEQGIEGVLVQLLNAADVVVAETVTDADGVYVFENLAQGDYRVRIPLAQVEALGGGLTVDVTALDNLASSTTDAGDPDVDADDNDDNGLTVALGWQSDLVTLGSTDASLIETEPTTEVSRNGGDDDAGWAGGTDARSNLTVDFGFYQLLRLGDIVWLDNGGNGIDYVAANEDDGEWDSAMEDLIDGVRVVLFSDGGDGVFNPADLGTDDVEVASTTTSAGIYYFTGLIEGDYWVAIPAAEHNAGEALENLRSSTGRAADDSANSLDQGEPETGYASVSQLISLDAGTMSNGDSADESRADSDTGITVADASSNLAIDFGFSPVPAYALGNMVWEDYDNDGVQDSGEVGIGNVTVELYRDLNSDGVIDVGEPLVDTTTTSSGPNAGRYRFEDLAAGDYLVHLPTQAVLDGWFVGGTPNGDADVDNDNNALTDAVDGWTSPTVTLGGPAGPGDHDEPTGETDTIGGLDAESGVTTRDDRSNQTYDFGFWRGLRLGNQVWSDEGAGANQDNGVYDSDEGPLTGVTVELWEDDGDGSWDEGFDSLVRTTTTDVNGRYFFENLPEGTYFVAIQSAGPGAVSSTNAVGSGLGDDGLDDGEPSGVYESVSGALDLSLGSAPVGETDGPGGGGGNAETYANGVTGTYPDASSYLTADFGFIGAPLYRIGNLVWADGDNDGVAETGEPGIDGVLVQLTDAAGTVLAETVTAGGGKYAFESLVAGTYRVQIPTAQVPVNGALAASIVADAIAGRYPSTTVDGAPDNDEDNDANGVSQSFGAQSEILTLGGTEPVTEQLRVDDATDDDAGTLAPRIDDNRSNFTLDFGYYAISLGNLVFFDTDGDGVFEPADGDAGVDDVTVELRGSSGTVVQTTITSGGGLYLFTGLVAGEQYYVQIPAAEFTATGDLFGVFSSPGDAGTVAASDTDGLDRGVDPGSAYGAVRSNGLWTATASGAPTTDGTGDNPDNDTVRPDAAENLVLDFGFYQMELGGTLFVDDDNDGLDTSAGDFAGVTLVLYHSDGSPYLLPNGTQASTVTNANGDYRFAGLPQGDYIVEIPASQFAAAAALNGWTNSDGNDPVPSPENDVTGEDNGYPVSGDIFSGGAVRAQALSLAVSSEPTDDPTESAGYTDAQSNLTVDFGFWHAQGALELGNQLWFDEDRDGIYDASETPVPDGVELQLRDADTDALVATQFTSGGGKYLFTGLKAGRYVVVVTAANFAPGRPLAGYMSTDGVGASGDPGDELDSDSNALPLTATGVRSAAFVLFAATPVGEIDPPSASLDDRQSNLTVDFGFVRAPVLVFTGADAEGGIRTALALLVLGAMLLIGSRRRRREEL